MCGRFAQYRAKKEYARALGIPVEDVPEDQDAWKPAYNVCPGTQVDVIRAARDRPPGFAKLWWGLLRATDARAARRPINTRAETAGERPSFRKLLEWRRCLIPADAYYEWQTTKAGKIPHCFRRRDGEPIFFAGLWDAWHSQDGGERIESFTMFTTGPNRLAAKVHDRMPVIVQPQDYALWLDPIVRDASRVAHLLATCPDHGLVAYPVSKAVSRPGNEGPELIEPAGEPL